MNAEQLSDCHNKIAPHIMNTPVLTSDYLNSLTGSMLFFKCENFQPMGAYKLRGAVHAILQLSREARKKGVVTHSSGNFAQALALAGRSLGVKATIVMPSTASEFKKKAVREYGGDIVECDPTNDAREAAAEAIRASSGATFIHPSNDMPVILGQATACMELLQEHPDLDIVVVPVGGGGLLAGTALAANSFGRDCKVYAGEPMEADDAYRSFYSGKLQGNETANTIADGLKTMLGNVTFPIIQNYVKGIIRVEEAEIVSGMRLLWERLKITAEPSSAVAFAAILAQKEHFEGKKVGVIISGGNVDLDKLPF